MIVLMTRAMHFSATGLLVIAVLVTFISPLTNLMPAPGLKYAPAAELFSSILLLAFMLTLRTFIGIFLHASEAAHFTSDRLDLICLRRC